MSSRFITILEAVAVTGKSRRTIQRLVQTLAKEQSDQVMQEKTSRGYIWKLNEQSVQQAFGVNQSPGGVANPISQRQVPAPPTMPPPPEKYMEVTLQGYTGMMAMHQEVKQVYEERLQEKELRIAELKLALAQAKRGLWAWLFGS